MAEQIYPAGTLVKVTAEICLSASATEEQIAEYLRYSMTESGGCATKNPLLNGSVDAWEFDVDITRYVGREEEFDSVDLPDGGREYKVRRIRERVPA